MRAGGKTVLLEVYCLLLEITKSEQEIRPQYTKIFTNTGVRAPLLKPADKQEQVIKNFHSFFQFLSSSKSVTMEIKTNLHYPCCPNDA